MTQHGRRDVIVTAEAVAITVDVAGLGSRMIAAIVDLAIQGVAAIPVILAGAAAAGSDGSVTGVVIMAIGLFLLLWGYYPLWEGLWRGRTPGKRVQRLRVVNVDGHPAGWTPILLRNLLRIVDFLPWSYAIGAITMLLTKRSQRIGDLVAGTIVIREPRVPEPLALDLTALSGDEAPFDTTRLGEQEYALVRSFLQRREQLDPTARATLASTLAGTFRPRVGAPAQPMSDEEFLEGIARSFRARFGPR